MKFIEALVLNLRDLNSRMFLLCLFFLFLLYKWIIQTNFTTTTTIKTNLPPSPPCLPVIGNLHQLTAHPHRGLHALSRKYGDIMLLRLGAKNVLVVSSATSASHIMKTHDPVFADRPDKGVFKQFLYDGKDMAASPYGEYWRQLRSISVLHLLSNSRVRSYNKVRKEEAFLMAEKIEGLLGKEVNLSEVCIQFSNDVICRVAFGKKYGDKSEFQRLLNESIALLGGFYISDFVPWLGWVSRLSGLDAKVDRIRGEFDEFLEGIVREHENRVMNVEINEDGEKDFMHVLLEIQRDETIGFSLERNSIKALIMDVFAAGTETSYTVLEWIMSELLRHPTSMKTLQAEIRRIVGSSPFVTEKALDEMKYLKATIKETMRLHPPLPLLVPRESTREVELNGYTIPARTRVITNAWAIQRDPAEWDDPDEFQPERFLNSEVDFNGQYFKLIPFGAGRRGCPGISFAMVSVELALATLVWKFDWSLPKNVEPHSLDMKEAYALSMQRKNPLVVIPTLPES